MEAERPPVLSDGERRAVTALFAAMLLLRVAYAFGYPLDSDEPQHLHVAWAWTRGLLPYRDVFDNHAPLFHVLSAPLVAVIGENPRILLFMRLALIPVTAAALWGSHALGRRLFGARAGAWAAVLCGLSPTFFFKSVEYRTDVLWAALWILAIAVFLGGGLEPKRGFRGGLLAGACLAVSLKTVMLLSALGIAAVSARALAAPGTRRSGTLSYVLAVLGGLAVAPAAIVLYFWARGALHDLLYCTVQHNLLPGVGRWGYSRRIYLLPPILALLIAAARVLLGRPDRAAVAGAPSRLSWDGRSAARLPALLACVELAVLPAVSPLAGHGLRSETRSLSEVLRLTDPTDYVLDLKGQAVFRNRPFYYALETMTLERMSRGLIRDTIPERCIETGTCVAPADIAGFPPRARRFLQDYYVVVGAWRVVGAVVDPATAPAGAPLRFDIPMRARYAAVAESGGL